MMCETDVNWSDRSRGGRVGGGAGRGATRAHLRKSVRDGTVEGTDSDERGPAERGTRKWRAWGSEGGCA